MKDFNEDEMWDLEMASMFCTLLESVAPLHGFHVALTGGCLYKEGARKDCDVILYRIRTDGARSNNDMQDLFNAFEELGVVTIGDFGFVVKAQFCDRSVDFLIPEASEHHGNYDGNDVQDDSDHDMLDTLFTSVIDKLTRK